MQAAGNNTSTSVAYVKTQLDLDASSTLAFITYVKMQLQLVFDTSRRE